MLTPDTAFERAVAKIKDEEGPYEDDPNDPGGATAWGWTQRTATACGYTVSVANLTWDMAVVWYKQQFWVKPQLDQLCLIDDSIAMRMFDQGVNIGPEVAGQFLQDALNVLSDAGRDYPILQIDGICGAKTRENLTAFVNKRGAAGRVILLDMIVAQQVCHYIDIADANRILQEYEYGWQVRANAPTVS